MADITIDQLETQTFYQIPQIFVARTEKEYGLDGKVKAKVKWTSKYARELSNDAKFTYALLYNRCLLSIRSYREGKLDFVDDNGSVFLIFTVEDLMDLLDRGKTTVLKLKKELANLGLLREVSMGANRPNRLYLQTVDASLWEKEYYEASHSTENSGQGNRAQTKITYLHTKTEDNVGQVIFQAPVTGEEKLTTPGKSGGSFSEPPTKLAKSSKSGGSENEPQGGQILNPTKIENTKTELLDDISSRRPADNSDELPQSPGADYQSFQDKVLPYVQPQYYALLQVIADHYNDRFCYPHGYFMTHKQKMLIGDYLQSGYVLSHEVLGMIDRIPDDCEKPMAYLMASLKQLQEERFLEAKIYAQREGLRRFGGNI